MTEFYIKINPFTNECSVKKNGENIPRTAKIANFYKSFLKSSFNVVNDIEDDYNIDSAVFSLETSAFEFFFFRDVNSTSPGIKILKRDFLMEIPLKERLDALCILLEKYADFQIHCTDINLSMSEADFIAVKQSLLEQYPALERTGFCIKNNEFPAICSVVDQTPETLNCSAIPIPQGEFYPILFKHSEKTAVSYFNGTFLYELNDEDFIPVIKSYIERFIIYPQIGSIAKKLNVPEENTDDYQSFSLLDKVDETIIVSIPPVVELGTAQAVKIETFFGGNDTAVTMESTYREIADVTFDSARGCFMLNALAVGDTEIKIFKQGELTPVFQKTVRVEDYGYATSVKILIGDKLAPNCVVTPGESVKLSLQYTPEDSPKTLEDVKKAKWSISDESLGQYDPETGLFTANAPGIVKVSVQLARVQHSVTMVIKPKVSDIILSLQNSSQQGINEVKMQPGRYTH